VSASIRAVPIQCTSVIYFPVTCKSSFPKEGANERAVPSLSASYELQNNLKKRHQQLYHHISFLLCLSEFSTLLQQPFSDKFSPWIPSSLGIRALLSIVKLSQTKTSKASPNPYHRFLSDLHCLQYLGYAEYQSRPLMMGFANLAIKAISISPRDDR
jgi:hypothetical protein